MTPHEKSAGGRPRSFDRDRALDIAMRMFWRHGYEGVSVADLTARLGIAAPSLYAAFGSKADLYREALKLYEEMSGSLDVTAFDRAETLEQAVRGMLLASIAAVTSPDRERGCLISDGMIACGSEHAGLAAELADRRKRFRDQLARRLERWCDRPSARALARYLTAVMQGMSIQARDGATPRQLRTIADQVVAGLPPARSIA
jgi:AcrR family transcriptional regulator